MDSQNQPVHVSFGRLRKKKETESALRSAVEEALSPLGGISQWISTGNRVLLKPNQTLFLPHKYGSTTSTRLIRVLVRMCFDAGAKEVWIAEAAGHAQRSRDVLSRTGMAKAVQDTRARLIFLDEIAEKVCDFGSEAGTLRYMPAPEIMERADVIINVPKAKTHFVDPISCACKNWVGVIPMSFRLALQREVDPYYEATAHFLQKFRPALNIVDGAWAGEGQGPGANDPFWWGWIIACQDPVATDVAVARLFGLDWRRIRMAEEAGRRGIGCFDWEKIEMVGASFEEAHRAVKPADPSVHRFPCRVIVGKRGATLEGTLGHWKTIADGWEQKGLWKLFTQRGCPTFLFGDAEDPGFEEHVKEGPYVVLDDAAADKYKLDPRVTFVPGSPVPQSYMQNEMVDGMGFGPLYRKGFSMQKMLMKVKGKAAAKG